MSLVDENLRPLILDFDADERRSILWDYIKKNRGVVFQRSELEFNVGYRNDFVPKDAYNAVRKKIEGDLIALEQEGLVDSDCGAPIAYIRKDGKTGYKRERLYWVKGSVKAGSQQPQVI